MRPLARVLGPVTTLLVGVGIAVGSGILRTPGLVATELPSPLWILIVWIIGGVFCLASGLVSAELSTRFPKAGGEYVYLREAYGEGVAFFFGWAFTVFIVGGGVATIGAAAGEAAAAVFGLGAETAPWLAAFSVAAVTGLNAMGLSTGAGAQNILTGAKILALGIVALLGFTLGEPGKLMLAAQAAPTIGLGGFLAALPPVLFAYAGTTDTAKLAEEVENPEKSMPRAMVGAALLVTVVYLVVNLSYLFVLSPAEMKGRSFVASDIFSILLGPVGERAMNAVSLLVFLGALSSTVLATVRVTFALARDGLAPSRLAFISKAQAPVPALVLVGLIATTFTLFRGFRQILDIYFLASSVLFGLTYLSLLVFRARDARAGRSAPPGMFRCPGAGLLVFGLIAVQLAIAADILLTNPRDAIGAGGLVLVLAVAYSGLLRWRRR